MSRYRAPIAAAAAALMLGVSGCISVLPEPVIPLALIGLPADRAQAPQSQLLADINVFSPDASRAYSGVDIAVRDDQELVYLADVRWVDAAPRLLQGAVVDALSKAQGEGMANPAQLGARADYDLRWRIVDFSVGRDTLPVRASVEANLVEARTRRVVAQQSFTAEQSPVSRAPRDRAASLAIAAQAVADQVAAFAAASAAAIPDPAN